MITTYAVTGMTCGHCVSSVRAELRELPWVTGVEVDLPTGAVTVTSERPLDEEAVRVAVDEAGYTLARTAGFTATAEGGEHAHD